MELSVTSEFGELEVVLVKKPGDECSRPVPQNMNRYLFDDILWVAQAQGEHDVFVHILEEQGVEVIYIDDLLRDVLDDRTVRSSIVYEVCHQENCEALADTLLDLDDITQLQNILVAGLTRAEAERFTDVSVYDKTDSEEYLLKPIPNLYFCRDVAAVVGDRIILCNMRHEVRIRESILMRYIIKYHPTFRMAREEKFLFGVEDTELRPYTVEGGISSY